MIPISVIYRFIKRGWWIILLTAIASGIAGYLFSSSQTYIFQTSSSYIVVLSTDDEEQDLGDSLYGIDALSRDTTANTYSEIINSRKILDLAVNDVDISPEELAQYQSQAIVLPETSVIRVDVSGPDPNVAIEILQNIGDEATMFISSIYNVYHLQPLDEALIPTKPISPNLLNNTILAAAIGVVFGSLLALFRTPELLTGGAVDSLGSYRSNPQPAERIIEYVHKNGDAPEEFETTEALEG